MNYILYRTFVDKMYDIFVTPFLSLNLIFLCQPSQLSYFNNKLNYVCQFLPWHCNLSVLIYVTFLLLEIDTYLLTYLYLLTCYCKYIYLIFYYKYACFLSLSFTFYKAFSCCFLKHLISSCLNTSVL